MSRGRKTNRIGGGRLIVTWTRYKRLCSQRRSAVTHSSSPNSRHHSRLSTKLVRLTGSPRHVLRPTLPEIRAISRTFAPGTFQDIAGTRSRTRIWRVSHAENIPPHPEINNRLFDNTALYFFIIPVIHFISQQSVRSWSLASYSKNLL